MRSRTWMLAVATVGLAGCVSFGDLDVSLPGRLQPGLLEVAASTSETPVFLAVDRLGNLTLNGHLLDLPSAAERRRFGLGAVDAGALPPPWRPAHAPQGGVLVTSLAKASPLAIAGLRPNDVVTAVNDVPVGSPDALVEALEGVGAEATVVVSVVRPDRTRARIQTRAAGPVDEVERLRMLLLFERSESNVGDAFGLGPFNALLWWCLRVDHVYEPGVGDPSRYVARFAWGVLGQVFAYERTTDTVTGHHQTAFSLFGIWFGDRWEEGR